MLRGRGELPYDFAVEGGWSHVAVATGAAVLIGAPGLVARRGVVLAWNVVGFLEILSVVATAARLAAADPTTMRALLRLPPSLLPTFYVPLVIATLLWIFWRAAVERRAGVG